MNLIRALDVFLDHESDVAMGGPKLSKTGSATRRSAEKVAEALESNLDAIQASATRWRVVSLIALCGLALSSLITDGLWQAFSLASAGGCIAALQTISRRKFAADLCIALVRAAESGDQRVKIVEAIRSKL